MKRRSDRGRLILVGAGPGDPDLITVRGATALGRADVALYDELASDEILDLLPRHAERINVGKRGHDEPTWSQEAINELIAERAGQGQVVVRLKGGDPFIFGRGGEEASACVARGIPFEVVPGVSSALAAPAYAGIPLTDRRYSASFAVVTGHKDPGGAATATRWRDLARAADTLVILMGMRNLRSLLDEIVAGGTPLETPAAAVMNGTRAEQRVELATLETLADAVEAKGLGAPSVIVIGQVAALGETLSWWESSPLFGLGALVSRAPHQARELAAALRAAGAIPSFRPLIDLVAVEDPGERGVIDTSLGRLADYDDLLFTSSNAVRFFLHHVERLGLESSLPGLNARILCIGPSTARAVTAAGLPVHFMLSGGRGDADSMLSELLRSHPPTGRRVLIPRSDIARDVLSRGLAAAGAHVDAVTHYRNIRPEVDAAALGADLIGGALPLLPFTSPSAVEHFAELLDEAARDACQRCIISAIGTTTAAALESIGLPPQVVPERPDVRGMVEALENYVAKGREAGSLPSGWGEKKK